MKRSKFLFAALLFLFALSGCDDFNVEYIESGKIEQNRTQYTVTFISNGGSSVSSKTVESGYSVYLPTPTRNGYTFDGWYSSNSGGGYYGDGGDYYTVYSNVTMYARWTAVSSNIYTITFNAQGGSVSPTTMSGVSGAQITLPVPTRNNYTFNGWYSSSSGGTKYDSPYTITSSLTMYAQWTLTVSTPNLGQNGSGNDGDEMTINGIACVLVKAGTFVMGSPTSESGRWDDETQHQVTLTRDFWISKYEVTQSQYQSVMGSNPSYFSGANNPVENVTWYNANEFCQAVGGQLPTEAQWEFAARGGNKSQGYIYSGSNNLNDVGWHWENNSDYGTKPVGQKLPNELGIYDMSGNVWEWCSDWYSDYSSGAVTNPTGPSSGTYRVLRGGGWNDDEPYCRVAYRSNPYPSDSFSNLGFRVAFPRN